MWRLPKPKFKVLMYGPDLPSGGVPGLAHFDPGVLVLEGRGYWYTVQSSRIGLKAGGFDGRQWLITWESPSGPMTAMLQGDEAVDAFIQLVPPEISGELRRARGVHLRREASFRVAVGLIAALVLLPVLALGLFWLNADRVVSRWAAERVGLEQEVALGNLAFAQMRPGLKLMGKAPVTDVVELIGARLTAGSKYRYSFHVAEDPAVNALAVPGGHVVVFTGLLRAAESAEEVAGVLAHEISHVERRHALRNLLHGLGWRAILNVALGDFSGGVWSNMAAELGALGYGRNLELEADLEGLKLLRRAGIPAEGMGAFFERLAAGGGPRVALLSTHPAGAERLAALRDALRKQGQYPSQPLPVDWARLRWTLPAGDVN